jgi:hypothetical protein
MAVRIGLGNRYSALRGGGYGCPANRDDFALYGHIQLHVQDDVMNWVKAHLAEPNKALQRTRTQGMKLLIMRAAERKR